MAESLDGDVSDFYSTFWRRNEEGKLKIPKAMEDAFSHPQTNEEREIKALIDAFKAGQAMVGVNYLVRRPW